MDKDPIIHQHMKDAFSKSKHIVEDFMNLHWKYGNFGYLHALNWTLLKDISICVDNSEYI